MIKIPKNKAPFTFLANKNPIIINPIIANSGAGWVKSPRPTIVPPPPTTIPAFVKPMRAINKPIPTDTDFFKFIGIESNIASLTLKNDSKINSIPSIKTAVRANCHVCPIPNTTE